MADIAVGVTDPGRLDQQERRRLAALVAADSALLDDLHADDFILVIRAAGEWDRAFYLGGIADGSIDYRRFEPVTPLQVMTGGGVAVVRYRSGIEIAIDSGPYVSLSASPRLLPTRREIKSVALCMVPGHTQATTRSDD